MKADWGRYLYITYLELPECFDEEIWENSNRIAKLGFFTDWIDIPKIVFEKNCFKLTLKGKELDYDFFGYDPNK